MRRAIAALTLASLAIAILAVPVAATPTGKVAVCHHNKVITVSSNTFQAHLRHGDHLADTALTGKTVYAIAYTNVNGVAGYQPEGCDVFISALVEASSNSVPDAGDEVLYGMYPTAFSAPYGFVAFPFTSMVALDATCGLATFDTPGDRFARWQSRPDFEDFVVVTDFPLVAIIRDDITGNLEDSITISQPAVFLGQAGPVDDPFLDVDLLC